MPLSKEEPDHIKNWRQQARACLESLPADFSLAKAEAKRLSAVFHEELAASLAPKLSEHLRMLPLDTHDDYKRLVSWCNHELHALHLSIRCPNTNRSAILIADVRRRTPDDDLSRFRLKVRDELGTTTSMSYRSHKLPDFVLMEEPPRLEGTYRFGEQSAGRGQ